MAERYTIEEVSKRRIQNYRNLDRHLVQYLERLTKGTLTGLELLTVQDEGRFTDFWRWKLVGIKDAQLKVTPMHERSLFFYLKPVLTKLWQPEEELLRVCTQVGCSDLILDFRHGRDIFKRLTKEEMEEADTYRYRWEEGRMGSNYNKDNARIIPGPIPLY